MENDEEAAEAVTRKLQLSIANFTRALTMANAELTKMTHAMSPVIVSKREIGLVFLDTDTRAATYGHLDKSIADLIEFPEIEVNRYAWKLGDHPKSGALVIFVTSGSSTTELEMVTIDKQMPSDIDILGIIIVRHGRSTPLILSSTEPGDSPLSSIMLPGSQGSVPVWQIRYNTKGLLLANTVTKNSLARIKYTILQRLIGPGFSPPLIVQTEVALLFLGDSDLNGNLAKILATSLRGYDAIVKTYVYADLPKSESLVIFVIPIDDDKDREMTSRIVVDTIDHHLPKDVHVLGIIVPVPGRKSALLPEDPLQPDRGVMTSIVLKFPLPQGPIPVPVGQMRSPQDPIPVPVWQMRYASNRVLLDDSDTTNALTRVRDAIRRQF